MVNHHVSPPFEWTCFTFSKHLEQNPIIFFGNLLLLMYWGGEIEFNFKNVPTSGAQWWRQELCQGDLGQTTDRPQGGWWFQGLPRTWDPLLVSASHGTLLGMVWGVVWEWAWNFCWCFVDHGLKQCLHKKHHAAGQSCQLLKTLWWVHLGVLKKKGVVWVGGIQRSFVVGSCFLPLYENLGMPINQLVRQYGIGVCFLLLWHHLIKLPYRELTYPTLGKGKSSWKVPLGRDMLVPRRVSAFLSMPFQPLQSASFAQLVPRVLSFVAVPKFKSSRSGPWKKNVPFGSW